MLYAAEASCVVVGAVEENHEETEGEKGAEKEERVESR